ncbi:MAG: rRNA pseudouridine synthase [Ruminococcaceae bacterium]|nr:rRNA pseudouridine synthase [Oscillospiraceae bacterium]
MELIRLDKLLSQALLLSRSDAKKKLRDSQVAINGKVCKNADMKVDPSVDIVTVGGQPIVYQKYVYIMLHKPAGVVSASKDPNEKTVVDLVPSEIRRKGLFPAGRLDKDTTGFVLITDDGDFAHRILAPGKHVPKTYRVTLTRTVSEAEVAELADGPVLDDEKLLPVAVQAVCEEKYIYSVVLMEGRYHQIKRMFAKQGNPVVALHRTQMGQLPLDPSLLPGECKVLSAGELERITMQ